LSLLHANEEHPFEQWFVTWVESCFSSKKDASAIHDLILWVKNCRIGRETKIPSILYRNVPSSVNDELRD
jgi:DNA polymerase-3 subunit delta'